MIRPGKIARLILGTLFKKPATLNYPVNKSCMPEGYRGKLKFNPELCVGCKMCMRDCPTGALEIKKVGEKEFELELNLGKCIYCGQCVDSCLKKAISMSDNFELANVDPAKLKVTLNAANNKKP